jgi:hypothetical protein
MSHEWQRARWKLVHERPWMTEQKRKELEACIWHVRPYIVKDGVDFTYATCDGQRFYRVLEWGETGGLMCEHECLTD